MIARRCVPVSGQKIWEDSAYTGLRYCWPRFTYAGSKINPAESVAFAENHDYGRTLYLRPHRYLEYSHLFVKGTGWNISELVFRKTAWAKEFYMGLVELESSGQVEVNVSNELRENGFFCARVVSFWELHELINEQGRAIKSHHLPKCNNMAFRPANVFFILRSKYRLQDLRFMNDRERQRRVSESVSGFGLN